MSKQPAQFEDGTATDLPVSANQALLDALKCEVEQFLDSARTERFTVASPNGGLRTEVRDISASHAAVRIAQAAHRMPSGFGALAG